MENLEKQLNKHNDEVIRKYLLDWLDQADAEEIDEKIITKPEFFDSVLLIEQEILEDLVAGRLSGEEKARAEQIYQFPANREKLDFAAALYKVAEKHRHHEKSIAAKEEISTKPQPRLYSNSFRRRRRLIFAVAAGFILVAGISLFIWLMPRKDNAFETEIARLNHQGAGQVNPENLREIALQNSARAGALMLRIPISGGDDEVIRFQMDLANRTSESYEAVFFDDRGNKLFSVSDLKPQRNPDGTSYIQVLVPSKFLGAGDFQINLQGQSTAGALTKAGSYSFRVIKQ